MRKALIGGIAAVVVVLGLWMYLRPESTDGTTSAQAANGQPGGGGGRGGGATGGGAFRPTMTVETTTTRRLDVAERVMVVGNLIGAATVAVVPRSAGAWRP